MSGLNVTIDGTVIPHFQNMQLRRSTKQYAINIETSGRRRITKPLGLIFLLPINVKRQGCPESTNRIERISMTKVPNQKGRACHY
jgi:hypothetical protein